MKKILSLVFVCSLALVLTACNTDFFAEKQETRSTEEATVDLTLTLTYASDNTSTVPLTVSKGETALDALLQLAETNSIVVESATGAYGTMIDSINGVRSDTASSKYWLWSLNGKMGDSAADQYVVQSGDHIEFAYGSGF